MKRTITSILSITLALVMVLSLAACGSNEPKKEDIVGHWEVYDRILNFNPDGTFKISSTREVVQLPGEDFNDYMYKASKNVGEGSWEIYGNTVKTSTNKFGFIDFTYEDGKLIDGNDVYTKK